MPSARRSRKPPEQPPVFFVDGSLGRLELPRALRAMGFEVVTLWDAHGVGPPGLCGELGVSGEHGFPGGQLLENPGARAVKNFRIVPRLTVTEGALSRGASGADPKGSRLHDRFPVRRHLRYRRHQHCWPGQAEAASTTSTSFGQKTYY